MTGSTRSVRMFPDDVALRRAAVESIAGAIGAAIRERDVCLLALSGGNTPGPVYDLLAAESAVRKIAWSRVHLLFADERCVPPDDPQSNFGMIRRLLLSRIPIPAAGIHRMVGEDDPASAARAYTEELRRCSAEEPPRLDLVVLGVGKDGHTASLFPGTTVLKEENTLVREVFVARLNSWRLTLTLPVLNAARVVIFLVAGKAKAQVVARILGAPGPDSSLPATLIRPAGETVWMLDEEAASAWLDR